MSEDKLRRFRDETTPGPGALKRVRGRLHEELEAQESCRAILTALPGPTPGAIYRVRQQLAASLRPEGSPWRLRFAATVAVVALAGLVLALLRPPPIMEARLESNQAWATLLPSEEVQISFQGTGEVSGTPKAPKVTWDAGTIEVEVAPRQGVALVVETQEATVRVVGTAFAVTRNALGTTVDVNEGRVAVLCSGQQEVNVDPGETKECLPTSGAGLLARARALQGRGADGAQVLATVELARRRGQDRGSLEGEFRSVRIQALVDLGRHREALAAAEDFLAQSSDAGQARRQKEIRQVAASLALKEGGCPAALAHLRTLADDPGATSGTLVQLSDCLAPSSPEEAIGLLGEALARETSEQRRTLIHGRLEALGNLPGAR